MSEKGIMHIELKTRINKYHPKQLKHVHILTLSEDDISDSLELKLPWQLCGFLLDFAPYDPRKVGLMSTRHPKIDLELERYGNYKYVLKNGWSSVVEAESFKKDDQVSLWAFRDVTNTLCFAMQHLEGSGSNFYASS